MNSILKSSIVLAGLIATVFTIRPAVAQTAPTPATGSVADGDKCTTAADCATVGATCVAPVAGGDTVCTPPVPAAKKGTGEACVADSECDSGFCEGGKCAPQADNGAKCGRNEGCSSGICLKNVCVECLSDADCVGTGEKCLSNTCQPKAPAPVPVPVSPAPGCPPGTVLVQLPSGSFQCVGISSAPPVPVPAPQPTAPVPAPAPQPISLETVCGSFPLSDPSSSDPEERIAGCVIYAQAQACGAEKKQFWGTCATLAQSKATGRDGVRRVQSFFATGLKLVVEKYGNRLSGRFQSATELTALTADLGRLATALARVLTATDALRLGVGTVTGGSRAAPRRTASASPRCEAGWTLLATTKSPVFGSKTGAWLCHRSGEEGPGSWAEPSYGPAPVAPVPPPPTAIPPSTSSR